MKSPLITMTALVGKPSENDIFSYLNSLKENGIEEVLIYPRSGCLIEYLSDEWFLAIESFVKCAQELDMSIWLYDDFNWPSGDAKGRVSSKEEFRLKAIKTSGKDIGQITSKSGHNSDIFGEKHFPNLLNPQAVDYFISLTHEEYYRRFGDYFGTIIKGIFTDEPSFGYCANDGALPYYEGMEKDYSEKYQASFFDDLYNQNENFCKNVMSLASSRFKECYIDKLSNWCKCHGILMTGHLMCDNEPFWSVKHNGDFLNNLSGFLLPGIDEIASCFDDRSEMALFGAIEYASNENGAMAELFALGPCDMSYAKKKCMLYLAASHKINHYFLAISHMDISGNLYVRDYFNDFAIAQPDFSGMRLLSEDAKIASEFAKKDYIADVYIKFPTDISLKNVSRNLDLTILFSLINELSYHGIQWKYIKDEKPTDAPIIELNENLELLMNNEQITLERIILMLDTGAIKDANGNSTKGIFRRNFNDGSSIILNLFAPEGNYIIDNDFVYLDKNATIIKKHIIETKKEGINVPFEVKYYNPNIVRLMYLNDASSAFINIDDKFNVRFAVRKNTSIKIDGKDLDFDFDYNPLPQGIREHYNITTEIMLLGEKIIVESENDLKYMPSTMIIGDFSSNIINGDICGISLTKRKSAIKVGEKVCDFGKVEFSAKITIPQKVNAIEFSGTKLYTLLYINGKLVDEKIASPYIFNIDSNLCGKEVEIKIVQYSSIGPIFGDVDYWDKHTIHSQWRGTPSTGKTLFGFDEINWIY